MTGATYPEIERAVEERLGPEAYEHSRAVGETAALLATVYGEDAELARLAGLLHDWDRELGPEDLVQAANSFGLAVDSTDLLVPYLLHARTAAADLARQMPSLPKEVLRAVELHTVGDSQMSGLDMIVYVADMIAPGRSYPGLDELRSLPGTVSLPDLFAQCYQQSVEHLVRSRKRIHPKTVEVWNVLVARGQQ